MYLKVILLYFLSFNIYANSQIDNINNFLNENRFSYEQVTENSTEVISGKLILDTLQIYLEIVSPYKESYLISKNFITYNDIDFSQQRTFTESVPNGKRSEILLLIYSVKRNLDMAPRPPPKAIYIRLMIVYWEILNYQYQNYL